MEKSRIIMQMILDLPKVCGKLEMDLDEGPQILENVEDHMELFSPK